MKTNIHHLLVPIALIAVTAAWTTKAYSTDRVDSPNSESPIQQAPMDGPVNDSAAIARMEKEQARIVERLRMSAPMEIELVNGRDLMDESIENGFIIEATLEEVEAALAAAAATPGLEDDKEALRLKHRGSYRYFAPGTYRFGTPSNQ